MPVYCDLSLYLEEQHADFYSVIKNACARSILRSSKKNPTLILLIPNESDIKTLSKLARGDKKDKASAIDILKSNTVVGDDKALKTLNGDKVTDVPGEKTFLNAKKADDFEDASTYGGIYVYHHTKSVIPKGSSSRRSHSGRASVRRNARRVGGGSECTVNKELRADILEHAKKCQMNLLGKTYDSNRTVKVGGGRSKVEVNRMRNAYIEFTLSLLDHLKGEDEELCKAASYQCALEPSDLFILVDQYCTGNPLISDELLQKWFNIVKSESGFTLDIPSIVSYIDNVWGTSEYTSLHDKIEDIRENVEEKIRDNNAQEIIGEIKSAYHDLENSKLESEDALLPSALQNFYQNHPGRKMAEDEFRYVAHRVWMSGHGGSELLSMSADEIEAPLSSMHNESMLLAMDYRKQTVLFNASSINQSVFTHKTKIHELLMFINSRYFLTLPISSSAESELEKQFMIKDKLAGGDEGIFIGNTAAIMEDLKNSGVIGDKESMEAIVEKYTKILNKINKKEAKDGGASSKKKKRGGMSDVQESKQHAMNSNDKLDDLMSDIEL